MIFVMVVAPWSSTLNANRGPGPASARLVTESVIRPALLAVSGLAVAPTGATNDASPMLARSTRTNVTETTGRAGNPRVIESPPLHVGALPSADGQRPRPPVA